MNAKNEARLARTLARGGYDSAAAPRRPSRNFTRPPDSLVLSHFRYYRNALTMRQENLSYWLHPFTVDRIAFVNTEFLNIRALKR